MKQKVNSPAPRSQTHNSTLVEVSCTVSEQCLTFSNYKPSLLGFFTAKFSSVNRGFSAVPVFQGVPECSGVPGCSGVPECSGVPGFSTC